MAIIVTTARQLGVELAKRLRADAQVLKAAALETAQQSIADAVKATNAAKAVDQGFFKLSWSARAVKDGAILENTAPYAAVLEYGRRPGRLGPPLAPIYAWVQRKFRGQVKTNYRAAKAISLGLSKGAAQRKAVRRQFGKEEGAVNAPLWGIAIAIRDKIHFRGTKPRRILRGVLRKVGKRYQANAAKMLRAKARK